MDTSTKILVLLSEAAVDALTPGQIAEATGVSLSAVNVHLAKLLQRRYVYFSGSIATSGRYAKQYSISPDGIALVASGHTNLILTNEDAARVAEQMLEYFKSIMAEEATRLEKLIEDIDARATELQIILRSSIAESLAMAKIPAAPLPVAEAPKGKIKEEPLVWRLASYEDGEDITPLVDKLKTYKIYRAWLDRRPAEYHVDELEDMPPSLVPVINRIALAAKAKYGWEFQES